MARRLVLLAMIACSSATSGSLTLVTGGESDVFSRAPTPTQLVVEAEATDGTFRTITQVPLPASSVDLGDQNQSDVVSLRVSGRDSQGARLVYGASLFLSLGALQNTSFPIFVQRTGEWARMPGALADAREAPVVAIVNRRVLLIAGGVGADTAPRAGAYDLATLASLGATPTLPRAPRSMVLANGVAVLIDDQGADTYSFTDGRVAPLAAPAGESFADVSGGSTFVTETGAAYLVGATRTSGAPTSSVFFVDTSGNSKMLKLVAPRLGAAAAYVPGRGLLVFGGSAVAAGAELIAPGTNLSVALAFAPDATTGAGAAQLAGASVLIAGGVDAQGAPAAVRAIDLACATACVASPWAPVGVGLSPSQVVGFDAATALLVGEDAAGQTRTFRLEKGASAEVTPRLARQRARALVSPSGAVLLVGGAGVVESFYP